MLRRCASIVRGLSTSCSATSRFVRPAATSAAISRSRAVSGPRRASRAGADDAVAEPAQLAHGLVAPAQRAEAVERGLGVDERRDGRRGARPRPRARGPRRAARARGGAAPRVARGRPWRRPASAGAPAGAGAAAPARAASSDHGAAATAAARRAARPRSGGLDGRRPAVPLRRARARARSAPRVAQRELRLDEVGGGRRAVGGQDARQLRAAERREQRRDGAVRVAGGGQRRAERTSRAGRRRGSPRRDAERRGLARVAERRGDVARRQPRRGQRARAPTAACAGCRRGARARGPPRPRPSPPRRAARARPAPPPTRPSG